MVRAHRQHDTSNLLSWGDDAPAPQRGGDQRSSNSFANGNNQNCGNHITDRSSTRLHAAPGGDSSMGSLLSMNQGPDDRFAGRNNNHNVGKFVNDGMGGGGIGGGNDYDRGACGVASGTGRAPGSFAQNQTNMATQGSSMASAMNWGGVEETNNNSRRAQAAPRSPEQQGAIGYGQPQPRAAPWEQEQQQSNGYGQQQRQPQAAPWDREPEQRGGGMAQQNRDYEARIHRDEHNRAMQGGGNASSNSFANGSNQNCGNMITDRRSTRVAAPPGGHSSFTLG